MVWHWLITGWRSLIANPLFTLITIASLSVGCCGALLAGANIRQHLAFERWVPNAERVLLIRAHFPAGPPKASEAPPLGKAEDFFLLPMLDLLQQKVAGIESQARVMYGGEGEREGGGPPMIVGMVDPSFFKMFGLRIIEGDLEAAMSIKNGLVLTESEARTWLGPGPWTGRPLRENNTNPDAPRVMAVVEDLPAATHLRATGFASVDQVLDGIVFPGGGDQPPIRKNWGAFFGGEHFIKVKEGVNVESFIASAQKEINALTNQANPSGPGSSLSFTLVPLLDIHMSSRETTAIDSSGEMTMLVTLGTAAAALLIVSGFNYVTLSLARSLRRRREVAVRKALGARQSNLVSQYLSESLIVTTISLAVGFLMAELLSPWFARVIGQPPELFNLHDPLFLGVMAATTLVLAIAVGVYPAFYLAHVRPRVGLDTGAAAALGPVGRIVSRALLFVQIAAATVLLVIALTMGAQSRYIANRPLGYTMTDTYTIPSPCPVPPAPLNSEQRAALRACDTRFLDFIRQAPGVEQASRASTFLLFDEQSQAQPFSRPGVTGEAGRALRVAVETDFMQMMGAKLLAGRFYDSNSAFDRQFLDRKMLLGDHTSDRAPLIVSRAFLPLINVAAPEDAIGKTITMPQGARNIKVFEIVGVVEDWHRRSLRQAVDPIIFTPGGITMQMVARIAPGRDKEALEWLRKAWKEKGGTGADDQSQFVDFIPLRESFETTYQDDQRLMIAVATFAAVSIAVAGVGIYGLSAFDMRRRVREIGIRKALGAAPGKVAGLIVGQQIAFAVVASALAWPIGFWLANEWLTGFVYRTSLGWVVLPAATGLIIAFVALAVSLNAAPAVAVRPSMALRLGT